MSKLVEIQIIQPSRGLLGSVDLPADKSIAHRSALFSALADGVSHIVGFPGSEDPQSTLSCLKQLGIKIETTDAGLAIHGMGIRGFEKPERPLDCGNSGTTMRLISGILAGQSFESTLIGDASLSARPMGRIMDPLKMMGAQLFSSGGHAPILIKGQTWLKAIDYRLPIASAQIKSCILLAGLYTEGVTTIIESKQSRDHTERMLGLSTVSLGEQRRISMEGGMRINPRLWSIPADFSAAAFFLVAGSILPESSIRLRRVGMNPSRTGLIDILRAMGADIQVENEREVSGEAIADLSVRSSELSGISVGGSAIVNIIDEIPILCIAAAMAGGKTEIREASELRHKETDRIAAMATGLRQLAVSVSEFDDGLEIEGGRGISGGTVDSCGDHRIAMAFAIAGLAARSAVTILGASATAVSYPSFWDEIQSLR